MQNNQKSTKRAVVDSNQTMIFTIVAIASVLTVLALMISRGLWVQSSYMQKVIGKKEKAVEQLSINKAAVAELSEAFEKFNSQSPNLLGGSIDGAGPRDGDNSTLILDALPNDYDFPALASSLEKLLTGYSIESIGGNDDALSQQNAMPGAPIEMPFTFEVSTNYDGFRRLLDTFNKSVRPFHIVRLELSGLNSNLKVDAGAKSYYQPEVGVEIRTEVVNR